MKMRVNPDAEFVKEMRDKIKQNDGYCPCRIEKTQETKCMCKDFCDMLEQGKTGKCHCGLYEITEAD